MTCRPTCKLRAYWCVDGQGQLAQRALAPGLHLTNKGCCETNHGNPAYKHLHNSDSGCQFSQSWQSCLQTPATVVANCTNHGNPAYKHLQQWLPIAPIMAILPTNTCTTATVVANCTNPSNPAFKHLHNSGSASRPCQSWQLNNAYTHLHNSDSGCQLYCATCSCCTGREGLSFSLCCQISEISPLKCKAR